MRATTRNSTRWQSIERQLPLLICGLLLIAVGTFALAAYQRVRHVLVTATGQRLQSASVALDAAFGQSMTRYSALLTGLASNQEVATFLATGRDAPAARRALGTVWASDQTQRGRVELRKPDGTVVLDTTLGSDPSTSSWVAQTVAGAAVAPGTPQIGPLGMYGDSAYTEAVAAVVLAKPSPSAHGDSAVRSAHVIGYVVDFRFLARQSGDIVGELIGTHARMRIGSAGQTRWTDLEHQVAAPPIEPLGQPHTYADSSGDQVIGVVTRIPGVPWLVAVEQPVMAALAPMQQLLTQIIAVAILVTVGGALGAWLVSRRITHPIVALAADAERVAPTSAVGGAPSERANEISRLADAFRRMAGRVTDSLGTAEAARANAEALASELQDRSVKLERQTLEAQALATELEQQFEEAQSLSEELEHSNEQLHESVSEADSSRQALVDIVESITDAFIAYDSNWRVTYINRRATEYFERLGVAGDPRGRNVWDMIPTTRGSSVEREMQRAMTERVTVAFETLAEGDRWLAIRAYPTRDGGVSAVWTDVTEAHREAAASAFLAEASRWLSSSLDVETTLRDLAGAAVPVLGDWCVVDLLADVRATTWPPVITRVAIVHQDPARVAFATDVAQRHPTDWTSPRGAASVLQTGEAYFVPVVTDQVLIAMAQSEAHLGDLRGFAYASLMTVPLRARGRTLGTLTFATSESGRHFDATDLGLAQNLADRAAIAVDNVALYREADRARANAEAANKAKLDFLASMSHELRTPLNAIAGYVQLLDMQVAGTVVEEQRRYLARIERAQGLLLKRINDMLNFAKIDSGTLTYTFEVVRVDEILAGMDALIQPQLTQRGQSYEYIVGDPSLAVRVDKEKFEQVLLNLLSNATKFTAAGGRINLACAGLDDSVQVMVSDTGVGIPPDRLDAIFEPFVQLDPSLTRERDGTGLGLAISRDLTRAMGGELTAVSAVGVGSTFTLTLPRAAVEIPEARLTRPHDRAISV